MPANFSIREPIWKTRSVGVAIEKILPGENVVEITYRTKDGQRLFPNMYTFHSDDVKDHPITTVRGVRLRMLRIADLKERAS